MMLWPLVASLCVSLVIVSAAGACVWWKLGRGDVEIGQKIQQIRQLEAESCASPAGQRVCEKGE
jgi:hypothetical protein